MGMRKINSNTIPFYQFKSLRSKIYLSYSNYRKKEKKKYSYDFRKYFQSHETELFNKYKYLPEDIHGIQRKTKNPFTLHEPLQEIRLKRTMISNTVIRKDFNKYISLEKNIHNTS